MTAYSIQLTSITHYGVAADLTLSVGQAALSTSVWIKTSAPGANRQILGNTSAATGQGGYAMYYQTDRVGSLNYTFYNSAGTLNSHRISGATSILDGNWHSVVCVYDGSGVNIHIYVDGVETSYIDTNSVFSGSGWTSIVPWSIGDSTGFVGTLPAKYAYPAIYYTALSGSDAATIATGVNLGGAQAQWFFTEGSGTVAIDQTANTHTLNFNAIDAWSADVPFPLASGSNKKSSMNLVF